MNIFFSYIAGGFPICRRVQPQLQTQMPRDDQPAPAEYVPLTPIAFDILLSLMEGEAHGYAIMQSVEERSGGATSLHAGTLYRALSRLVEAGLIEELPEAPEEGADGRRRYYRITGVGRKVAAAEARRLENQLGAARDHGLLGPA
jgi:DNA-binding PadR family transcriptional regulator